MANNPNYRPNEGEVEPVVGNNHPPVVNPDPTDEGPNIDGPLGPGLVIVLSPIQGLTSDAALPDQFIFQASPLENFGRDSAFTHTDFDALAGQFSRPGGRALEQVSFQSVFVDYNASWDLVPDLFDEDGVSVFAVPNPLEATKHLRRILHSGRPFLLTAANPQLWDEYDLRMPATMRSLHVEERSGEVDARYVDVSFTEYRDPSVARFLKGRGGGGGGGKGGKGKLPVTLLVNKLAKGRDTFHELAKHYYKDPSNWHVIRQANPVFKGTPPTKSLKDTPMAKKTKNLKVKIPRKPGSGSEHPPFNNPPKDDQNRDSEWEDFSNVPELVE